MQHLAEELAADIENAMKTNSDITVDEFLDKHNVPHEERDELTIARLVLKAHSLIQKVEVKEG